MLKPKVKIYLHMHLLHYVLSLKRHANKQYVHKENSRKLLINSFLFNWPSRRKSRRGQNIALLLCPILHHVLPGTKVSLNQVVSLQKGINLTMKAFPSCLWPSVAVPSGRGKFCVFSVDSIITYTEKIMSSLRRQDRFIP